MAGTREQIGQLVRLGMYQMPKQDPVLRSIRTYWEELRQDRTAPMRKEIDPRAFGDHLEHVFVLDRSPAQGLRFRLAGLALCDLVGMELRGMPFHALFDPRDHPAVEGAALSVQTAPEIAEFDLTDPVGGQAQMLILPVRDDFDRITKILGCLVRSGPDYHPPLRFGLRHTRTTRIVAAAGSPPLEAPAQPAEGFAEPPASFEAPAKRKGPGQSPRPYLRLVKSDD